MSELTTVEQAQKFIDLSQKLLGYEHIEKLAQDYITVLAGRDLAQSQLLECQWDLKAGNEQGEKAREAYREAANERDALLEAQRKSNRSRIYGHIPPVEADIEANREKEPEGERIRQEFIDFLERNNIVSMCLDTPNHAINLDIAKLPPVIKPVLTLWGSIYVRDSEKEAIDAARKENL